MVISRNNARFRFNWLSLRLTPTPARQETHGSQLNRVSTILVTVLVLVYPSLAWPQTAEPIAPGCASPSGPGQPSRISKRPLPPV